MVAIRETECKSVLNASGITEYCVNCYTGCLHGCVYCYARFMRRFSGHKEPWGQFVDIKMNAPQVLAKEAARKPKGGVFVSSVCDGWQPLEEKYRLTRQCLRILLENGFQVSILTKNRLVKRDFDLMKGYSNVTVGMTITTMDEELRRRIEPACSPSEERVKTLEEASERGIEVGATFGPLLPFLSDTEESLEALFSQTAELPLSHIYVDKLNLRPQVWPSVMKCLSRFYPHLIAEYRRVLFSEEETEYLETLRARILALGEYYGLAEKMELGF